ncbi:MAG: 2Fe-2S iron-sulfur cluster binding domain-containing protein [Rhodothermales bacterium]|nr:2Fe-2S iron-sulfur cluster binding domain-containing protein [Rhodothermales bacterium]
MATVTIDNKQYEFEGRPLLLQFCTDRGIEIPHFCYHPSMSVPANCRQCLVKAGTPAVDRATRQPKLDEEGNPVIQYFPKLMTSCSMEITDGMVVHTHRSSELVERAQKDNLEFLLVNHPLDCPICDQAGHCPLQIQAYKYGPEGSRFEFEKVHKPKHIKLGPRVMLDGERCINCTRCTRFTAEVSGSHQLTIIERGVNNFPMTPPGVEFDEPYSMNVIDICPVGALTSIDFRFKARIWEMSSAPSITATNAKGSNCFYWVKNNEVLKITARQNTEVNDYWLPDEDREGYQRFNDDRPHGPSGKTDGGMRPMSWEESYAAAVDVLETADPARVLFVGSPHATVEDNYLLSKLAGHLGADTPVYLEHTVPGSGDNWLITDDKTPNASGCERLGFNAADVPLLRSKIQAGGYDVIYVLEDDPVSSGLFDSNVDAKVILHYYNTTNATLAAASVAFPAAMIVETVGTYVNVDGHAQRVRPAKAVKGVNRTLQMEMGKSRLDQHGTPFDKWYDETKLVDCKPGWEIIPEVAKGLGLELSYRGPKQIMEEVSTALPSFTGATYESMGLVGVRLSDTPTLV